MNTYASLYPLVNSKVKGCPKNLIMQALYMAGERFCDVTESWEKKMTGISLVAYQDTYTLPIVYAARVKRIDFAWIEDRLQDPSTYELVWTGTTPQIRFNADYIPTKAITAGSAWATSTGYAIDACVMYNDVNYKCIVAHTSGTFSTDRASGYWNITDSPLAVQVSLVPYPETNEFETNWFEHWGIRGILAGALAQLKGMTDSPWHDDAGAKIYGNQFIVSISEAKVNKHRQNKGGDLRVTPREFV